VDDIRRRVKVILKCEVEQESRRAEGGGHLILRGDKAGIWSTVEIEPCGYSLGSRLRRVLTVVYCKRTAFRSLSWMLMGRPLLSYGLSRSRSRLSTMRSCAIQRCALVSPKFPSQFVFETTRRPRSALEFLVCAICQEHEPRAYPPGDPRLTSFMIRRGVTAQLRIAPSSLGREIPTNDTR
jgi:hypothetical protein